MSQPHRTPRWLSPVAGAVSRRRETRRRRSLAWRLLAPVVFVVAGTLFVASAVSSGGTDLRAERYDDLADLATSRSERLQRLQDAVTRLSADVDELSETVANARVDRELRRVDRLRGPAGLTPVQGPGVTVTLTDAPEDVLASAGEDLDQAIVHQQDIQAVVNALWDGGAEAMTIQGQRVTSTMGIKCVGNAVVLHGVPYSPPYVVSAIGNGDRMLASVERSPYIQAYLDAVEAYDLGWEVRRERRITAPGSEATTELQYARPATAAG